MKTRGLVFEEERSLIEPDGLYDISRYAPAITGVGVPTWTKQASGLWLRTYDGSTQYHYAANAATKQLDFTTGDYSILCWLNWIDTTNSLIIVGRYELDVGGWEIYLYQVGYDSYLTQRHHHAGTIVEEHPRTASYSLGWTYETPMMMCITRKNGGNGVHYRNGVSVEVTSSAGGLLDAESCSYDMVFGVRYSKNADYYEGQTGLLKIFNYALSATQVRKIFDAERDFFGV